MIEILQVAQVDPDELVQGLAIDRPVAGTKLGSHLYAISGWVLGRPPYAAVALKAYCSGALLGSVTVSDNRQDVAAAHPGHPRAESSGFTFTGLAELLPQAFVLQLGVELADGAGATTLRPIAEIRGRHFQIPAVSATRLTPLFVTALEPSAAPKLCAQLAAHPALVALTDPPGGVCIASYLAHAGAVLCEPGLTELNSPENFFADAHRAGPNPFNFPPYLNAMGPSARDYLQVRFAQEMYEYLRSATGRFYASLADDMSKFEARYFVERLPSVGLTAQLGSLFPDAREIILVRDFRDAFCEARRLVAEDSRLRFGFERAAGESEWLALFATGAQTLVEHAQRQPGARIVKYEEWRNDPAVVLGALFEDLGVQSDPQTVNAAVGAAAPGIPGETEIGAWRTAMSAAEQGDATKLLGPALQYFGH